jgi:hypothetical protein
MRLRRIQRRWARYWSAPEHDPLVIFWAGIRADIDAEKWERQKRVFAEIFGPRLGPWSGQDGAILGYYDPDRDARDAARRAEKRKVKP